MRFDPLKHNLLNHPNSWMSRIKIQFLNHGELKKKKLRKEKSLPLNSLVKYDTFYSRISQIFQSVKTYLQIVYDFES